MNEKTETHNFYDKNLGWVTTKITTNNNMFLGWITQLFSFLKQTVAFTPNTINLGDSVTMRDDYTIKLNDLSQSTDTNGRKDFVTGGCMYYVTTGSSNYFCFTYSHPYDINQAICSTQLFTPTKAGTYTSYTEYQVTKCISGATSTCTTSGFYRTFSVPGNGLTVNNPQPTTCTNQPRWTGYSLDHTITNGEVDIKTHITVSAPPECTESNDETQYQTKCNDNNHCSTLTDADQICPIQDSCVANAVANISNCVDSPSTVTCTSPQICEPVSKTCIDPQCNDNQTLNCTQGYIITALCINNQWVNVTPTPTCPNTNQTTNTTTNNTQTNQTVVNNTLVAITCYSTDNPGVQQVEFGKTNCNTYSINSSVCDANKGLYPTNQACIDAQPGIDYVLWGSILGSVLLILIIVIVIVAKRRKK